MFVYLCSYFYLYFFSLPCQVSQRGTPESGGSRRWSGWLSRPHHPHQTEGRRCVASRGYRSHGRSRKDSRSR
ncbi:hypothetical protein E2C01_076899 [Portunus trituberculatus]|uniref:Secreted protein n=1 Tax=Portunus trituberculatus TaxID=210409 RepID=A0A5B7IKA4_PORTR|nr:hypothetical protein [Portunus trituberculatus]